MSSVTCSLNEFSPRSESWYYVFQRFLDIPLKSVDPVKVTVPDYGETDVYFLNLDLLTPGEIYRLMQHLSNKFNISPEEVKKDLLEKGCPIPAQDIVISVQLELPFSKKADDYFEEDRIGDIS